MRRGFHGAKPDKFCFWIFEGLNLTPDDEFHDLFPGSGAVGGAWQKWKNRMAPEQLELVGSNAPHEGRTAALSPGVPLDAVVGGQKSALTGRQ